MEIHQTDQPTKVRAMVPFPSVWRAWEYYNEAYNAGRMIARADDSHFLVYRNPLTGEYAVTDGQPHMEYHPGMKISYERNGRTYELPLKSTGRLKLWLPELERMVFVTLKTTSFYDCQNISANLAAVQGIADALNNGNAAGIPLWIYRKEQEIVWNKPDGSASRIKKWLVQIEVDPAFVKQAFQRMSQFALTGAQPAGYLQPGEPIEGHEDPEIEEDDVIDDPDWEARSQSEEPMPATTPEPVVGTPPPRKTMLEHRQRP